MLDLIIDLLLYLVILYLAVKNLRMIATDLFALRMSDD